MLVRNLRTESHRDKTKREKIIIHLTTDILRPHDQCQGPYVFVPTSRRGTDNNQGFSKVRGLVVVAHQGYRNDIRRCHLDVHKGYYEQIIVTKRKRETDPCAGRS